MEFEVSYALDNEQQFWDEIDEIVSTNCQSHELIDNSLRNYLNITRNYKDEYLQTEYDIARCSYRLLESVLFTAHKDYVRRQIMYCLLQEEDLNELHLIAAFLLFDGKQNEATFEAMNEEGAFPQILELIRLAQGKDDGLHRILLQLLYEMSRIQRIKVQELMLVEDDLIFDLLRIIETLSDDVSDPYHYPVIRILLVLSEQYMVNTHDPSPAQASVNLPNKVIRALSQHGHAFKTFGENIILLLNRESETSLQLLILKFLFLIFTTPSTYEYFYTNDLRVLVDVIIRNLLDLPHSAIALRHTYLRVLHPLLAHTQLAEQDNHYKRDELRKVLRLLAAGPADAPGLAHFGATDETTRRLGARCAGVKWLQPEEETSPVDGSGVGVGGGGAAAAAAAAAGERGGLVSGLGGGALGHIAGNNGVGRRSASPSNYLGIGLNATAAASSLSVVAVVAPRAKPGEQTPSLQKHADNSNGLSNGDGGGSAGGGGGGDGGGSGE